MSSIATRIADNYQRVMNRVAEAALRNGREADSITMVGVTKYVEADLIEALIEAGCQDLGESRPQQLWSKAEQLPRHVRWHLIGHLQRNKVARTLQFTSLIHSIDSERLIRSVDQAADDAPVDALLEVNVSGDRTKHGFSPSDLPFILEVLPQYGDVCVRGLMTMAGLEGGAARARKDFAALRKLRDGLSRNCPEEVTLDELSMGMSGDFEEAIAEGATIVRVGSALFEGCGI